MEGTNETLMSITLTDVLFDQCNLDYRSIDNLRRLEDYLFSLIKLGQLPKESAINQVQSFCRGNSGAGYYDNHGNMKYMVEIWWESMVDLIESEMDISSDISPPTSPKVQPHTQSLSQAGNVNPIVFNLEEKARNLMEIDYESYHLYP